MSEALAWVGQIAEWIGQFIPRWKHIDTTFGGVKFTGFFLPRRLRVKCGGFDGEMKIETLGPGLHWFWPATSTIDIYPTARQTDDLRSQTLVTTDGKSIVVSGMVVYEVVDVEKLLTQNFKATQTISDISLTAVHDVCCQLSWQDLQADQRSGALDKKLLAETRKALAPYGVKVVKTMLTDLAPCRVLRLLQSTATTT